jgi:hypothetical protein
MRTLGVAIAAALLFAAGARAARADEQCVVHWQCNGSAGCEADMGGDSGTSGPFSSADECQSWIDSYDRMASCDCQSTSSGSDESSSDDSGGLGLPPVGVGGGGGGLSPQQATGIFVGAVGIAMIFGAIEAESEREARATAAAQAEAERQRRLEEARENAMRTRLLGEMKGMGDDQLALKGMHDEPALGLKLGDAALGSSMPPPPQLVQVAIGGAKAPLRTAAFLKGKRDASDCGTQNSGGYCVGLSPDETVQCVDDYHAGYAFGERAASAALQKAYRLGREDHAAKRKFAGLAPGLQGVCGAHAVEAYSAGFFNRPDTEIGR